MSCWLLYKSLVRPHVEYCTPMWSTCYQKDKILIERVQHRYTRMIPVISKLTYHKRLELLGLWSLKERRNRADLVEVFKMVKGLSAMPLESMFELSSTKHLYSQAGQTQSQIGSETALFHRATCQQMEQSGSAHIECKYCECSDLNRQSPMGFFEDWSSPNPVATQVLLHDWCGHTCTA